MAIKIYNKDCMLAMKEMEDNAFELAIVDIPYGLGNKLTQGGTWAKKYGKQDHKWDILPKKKYFDELFRVSKNQIIWGGNYADLPPTRCYLVWDKIAHLPTMADCELGWTSFDKNTKIFKHVRNTTEKRIHITQKPIKLYEWILTNYAQEGDKILDTHLGSGSSAIACHKLGYDFVGYEINKEFYLKTKKRIEERTKQTLLWQQ
jgi:site-specific DNA-methyltransferase (adenine-specific)